MNTALSSLLWFGLIVAMIPLVLWLLKRAQVGSTQSNGVMRMVAALSIAPGQRLVTVEVGDGDERRWLVLGVTGQSITPLHTMAPQPDAQRPAAATAPFAQLLTTLRRDGHRTPNRARDAT